MQKKRNFEKRNFEKGGKLSLGTAALLAATLAPHYSAYAQPNGANRFGHEQTDAGPVQPPTEFDEQAKGILARSAQRYKALKSWHIEEEVVNAGRFSRKITVDFRDPQDLVVATSEAKGIKTVAYYDGTNVTTIRDFDSVQEYQVSPLHDGDAPQTGAAGRSGFGNALGQYLSGFFAGGDNVFGYQRVQTVKYTGEGTVDGIAVDNVTATLLKRNQPVTVTYSIGKDDSLLHKVVQTGSNPDGTPSEIVETYSNQKVDGDLPDSTFQLTIPKNATKVERFTQSRGIQVNVGDKPFAINGKDIDGKALSLEQYKGKVLFLDFWATWCGPCRAELPNLKAAYAKYKDQGFDVMGISFDQTTNPLKPFLAKESIGWRQVFDGYWNGPIATAYNVRFIPSTVLIGRDGKVAAVGVRGEDLDSAIEAALAK